MCRNYNLEIEKKQDEAAGGNFIWTCEHVVVVVEDEDEEIPIESSLK